MNQILTLRQLEDATQFIAKLIKSKHSNFKDVIFVGIQQGGAVIGAEIVKELEKLCPLQKLK